MGCPIKDAGQRVASRKVLSWSHTAHQDKFQRIKHFNIENETINVLEETVDFFHNRTRKKTEIPGVIKERTERFDYANIQNFCMANATVGKATGQRTHQEQKFATHDTKG